ncbi:DUF4166 domain-containing protein [uncultured Roseobacter sp.]|uniref:DUF4166 domain-containing protein n=1 Tax=uncultured Roseobacter sp. TaxID=114847 RepID=UPI00260E472A|nr:DUF4166 domain-containing protein [uncultured Roseobacter sp.]
MSENEPFFEKIFGEDWATMPEVFHAHYANRTHRDDVVRVTGLMDIRQSWLMRLAAPLFRMTKTLVPVDRKGVDTEVIFRTHADNDGFWYHRHFRLGPVGTYEFVSRLEHMGGNQVTEWTGAGIGWHSTFAFAGGRVRLEHIGYRFKLGRLTMRLPVTWLFGVPSAWEEAIDDTHFRMEMTIRHWLFGYLYSYSGAFEIDEVTLG